MAALRDAHPAPHQARWLNAEEHRAWRAMCGVLLRLDAALDAQLRRDAGMRHFEYVVMSSLSQAPGRSMRMSELATVADGSLPRLSQVVSRLEAKGWVRRTPDPTDGRSTLAVLTDSGNEQIVAAAPAHVEEVRRLIFDPLTKAQVEQITRICERIAPGLAKELGGPDSTPPPPHRGTPENRGRPRGR
jgi:DNA-binding MarR family transcriptional regulator